MLGAASLAVLAVFALGSWPWRRTSGPHASRWQSGAVVYGRGLLLGYALGLVAPSLTALAGAWWLAVAWGAVAVLVAAWRTPMAVRVRIADVDLIGLALAGLVLLALLARVMDEPLAAWDARSIWYFHAKVLFHADHALDQALWTTPAIHWSHVDYPKLNAVWAAVWTKAFAGWNEFLPKYSLFLLEVPVVLLCVGFSRATVTRCLLLAMLVLRMDPYLWNGYMDGLLASYAGLGLLYGIRYVRDGEPLDLMTVLVASGICAGVKNEGTVVAACLLGFTLAGRVWQQRGGVPAIDWRVIATAGYALLGPAIWSAWRASAGVTNQVAMSSGSLTRVRIRLAYGDSLASIWKALAPTDDLVFIALCILAAGGFWALNRQRLADHRAAVVVGVGVPLVYLAVLTFVYLGTPFDLTWHLRTSTDRTSLVLYTCVATGLLAPILASDSPARVQAVDVGT